MKTTDIGNLLINKIQRFSEEIGGLSFEYTETKHAFFYRINLKLIGLEFAYTKKERTMMPSSLLMCRVYLHKSSSMFYHFPELMKYIGPDDFRTWYFSCIESETRLDNCFEMLAEMVKEYIPALDELVQDGDRVEIAEKEIEAARLRIALNGKNTYEKIKEEMTAEERAEYLEWVQTFVEEYTIIPHFTRFSPYELFLDGAYEKALRKYEKYISKGMVLEYEIRLCEFIRKLNSNGKTFEAIPQECNAAKISKQYRSDELRCIVIEMAAGIIVCGIVYMIIIAIVNSIISNGAEYFAGVQWYYGMLFGGLPGLFGGIAYRLKILKILKRKSYDEIKAFDEITSSDMENKVMKIVAKILAVGTTVFLIMILQMSTLFYNDYMMYDSGEKLLSKNIKYEYKDITNIYFVEGRYNDFGEWIGRKSYIIQFNNGDIIDLDGVTSLEDTEKNVFPLIEKYVSEVIEIKSEEDIGGSTYNREWGL